MHEYAEKTEKDYKGAEKGAPEGTQGGTEMLMQEDAEVTKKDNTEIEAAPEKTQGEKEVEMGVDAEATGKMPQKELEKVDGTEAEEKGGEKQNGNIPQLGSTLVVEEIKEKQACCNDSESSLQVGERAKNESDVIENGNCERDSEVKPRDVHQLGCVNVQKPRAPSPVSC
eukprot:TRINITY_DN677_c0_g1_i2.p1 TRINITY_DN677_c0_g1~~TRINITY_DN677_c0_g1_i2.p1  ORF type:complete len:170 (+),score=49.34 TRINITY_DN677_c0_g1_i2:471-980(+)